MNYLDNDDPNILTDLTRRKEFYQYYQSEETVTKPKGDKWVSKYDLKELQEEDVFLDPQSYQSSVANFLDPNTPYSRLLLKWDPGMGKTIASLNIAMRFIKIYERESQMDDGQIGSVFVIGFTEDIFKKELLSFPKYGFINREELKHLNNLRTQTMQGSKVDQDRFQEFQTKLRKRLTSRRENGYFKFYGYKAFVNRIFVLTDFKRNINDMSEDEIRQSLKDGSLKWNRPLLESFKNSLIICDELHVVYNSKEKNNWGVAIQMVIDYDKTIKWVGISATPINNSPTEVVDLANFMRPPSAKLTRDDLFDGKRLRPGSLQKIRDIFRGRISFVQDSNPDHFAELTMNGEAIEGIPYLKFVRCPMSKFHYQTYEKVYTGVLAQDAQYLMDIALPNPTDPEVGLYRTNEIKRALSFVTDAWFKKYGFKMQNDIIIGPGLEEQNIGEWSTKMYQVLVDIKKCLTPQGGKILVYHDVVHVSGVLFIEQLLNHNGFISIDQNETQNTLCAICGVEKQHHIVSGGGDSNASDYFDFKKGWRVVPFSDKTDIRELWSRAITGDHELPRDLTACNTFVMITDEKKPVAFVTCVPEDSTVCRIEHLIVDPEYHDQDIEEYLLEYYTPAYKVIVVIVPEENKPEIEFWTDLKFVEHDRSEGKVYLNFDPEIKEGGSVKTSARTAARSKIKDHEYMPARYTMAHSEIDSGLMQKNIDRFNAIDNVWGYHCRLVVGSKIIKQSYNFKAIRRLLVTARPTNIATLIQIFGRSRRKKGHLGLPPEYRNISASIYTSCLPKKDKRGKYLLSHEEIKYREKVEDYQQIQIIEREIHKVAIDGITARNIVTPGLDPKRPGLGALWFEPDQSSRVYKLKDLNLNTFNIYHSDNEIREIIYIIKRLYIEVSLCFKFDQLWELVQNPPFKMEINTTLFEKKYFVIALSMLVYQTQTGYVRPSTETSSANVSAHGERNGPTGNGLYLLDILHSDIDKRIMQSDGTLGYIQQFSDLYIYIPFREGEHDIYIESPFRKQDLKINKPINIMRYVKESTLTLNYENQKLKFRAKYENVPLEKLATVVGKFGVSFHIQFIEELIHYIFNLWTNPSVTMKSEMHEFYFKMLYFYDLMGLVVWAATAKEFIYETYKAYILPFSAIKRAQMEDTDTAETHSLKMSISNQKSETMQSSKKEFLETLNLSLNILTSRAKSKKATKDKIVKADPKLLPIGHFMSNVPRFYHPEKEWFESPEYIQKTQEYKENDIIIGYYEKGVGLRVKFKIRTPVQFIQQHRDIRMVEKGSICSSNTKDYLLEIAEKLKIPIADKINVPNLCSEIESKLQLNELEERKKKTNIKWFYSFWEPRVGEKKQISSMSSTK